MNQYPIILANGVEVVSIASPIKEIGMLIHLTCTPLELTTPETIQLITAKMDYALKYLIDEGFINTKGDWKMQVGTIIHNPNDPPSQFGTTAFV